MGQKSTPTLVKWSYQEIFQTYRILGGMLAEYEGVNDRVKVPKQMHIDNDDATNLFILRFWRDVKRINLQLTVLDAEIARRNSLIGVIG